MKIKNPMLVVTDINKSLEFYIKVLGLHVITVSYKPLRANETSLHL